MKSYLVSIFVEIFIIVFAKVTIDIVQVNHNSHPLTIVFTVVKKLF